MGGFDPGRVRVRLTIRAGVVEAASVSCERPAVARLLRGQAADQAVALVPLIYSLCGKAQGIAARAALAAAYGSPGAAHVDAEALAEAAREHAWKIFVDWPRQLALAVDEAFFVRLQRASPEQRKDMARELAAHPLPAAMTALLGTGDIDRLLAERIADRLGELSDWLLDKPGTLGMVSATCVEPGIGAARVETARGGLLHRLALDGDRIADYAITAPTDVHFAAGGDAARWLDGLRGLRQAEAEARATRLVMAFDPCVPWDCAIA
jgi:coenzyme F420-reducing hydrogenase alpha subunit